MYITEAESYINFVKAKAHSNNLKFIVTKFQENVGEVKVSCVSKYVAAVI